MSSEPESTFIFNVMRITESKLLLAAVVALFSSCGSHVLFKDGKSDYSIVVAGDAPASEQYAATELRDWIREVSGAELPITGLSGGVKGKRLVVGYNPLLEELVPGSERPGDRDDSFTWQSCGGDILFWGGSKRGTLYSVYSFLEDQLGCRWYSSKVSVAPKRHSWKFRKLGNHEEPGIIIRDNCVLDVRTNPTFSARLRNNFVHLPGANPGETIPGTAEGYWGVHAMGSFISPEEFYGTHPEYFSFRDGKRLNGYSQLCLSNPDVLKICIERVKQVMRDNPDHLIYSVEQNDDQLFCECDECKALAEQYGGQSGVMLWFVNQVADAVKEEFPDKYIGTFAYQYTRHAPKNIVPRDNVVVRLCSIECCMLHGYDECNQNRSFLKDLQEWSAIAPHLYIWDYVTDFAEYCLPVANWKTMQPHIQDFRDNHAIGIIEEGDYQTVSCELREMRSWLLSKLMWNPDADVDALIRDFTDGYYGAAGPFIRKYLDLEERILRRHGIHANCYIIASDEMYTDEFVNEGRKLFAEAKAAVSSDPEILARVETAEMPLCFLQMERTPVEGIRDGADRLVKRVVEREGIDRMAEGAWAGGVVWANDMLEKYGKIASDIENAALMPAREARTSGNGVAYTRYKGDFMTTSEMLAKGIVSDKGTKTGIAVDEEQVVDHFGYVFDTWLKVEKTGIHQFSISSDDGAVLFIDGNEVLNLDGSHSVRYDWTILNLEEGMHRLELRYCEDTDTQSLYAKMTAPDGSGGPLAPERLFIPEE